MNQVKKNIFRILLIIFGLAAMPMVSQSFGETPEHKRMWKKFGRKKHRDAFNPNVDSKTNKATHETSRKLAKEDKKVLKRANKEAMKQFRKNKRKVNSNK